MTINRFHSLFSRRFSPRTHAVIVAERCGDVSHGYFSHERRLASCFVIQE
jgi:hypothetical protein